MATIIDPALAKSLIQEYQQQNSSAGGPGLLTPDQQFLNGFFLDRQSLEALLSNKNVVGISLNFAKNPAFAGQPNNIFTLIYAGAEPNPVVGGTTLYVNTGDVYDDTPPCPPFCSNLA